MKKILLYSVACLTSVVMLSSCIGDLDTLPLNPTDNTSETAYKDKDSYLKGMAYVYSYFALVSQNDAGSSDLNISVTSGETELVRQYTMLNEVSTDAVKCAWKDAYMGDLQYDKWTSSDNAAVISVYSRCMKAITTCNEYFLQTADDRLAARGHSDFAGDVHKYRAEMRFMRALYYYILLDLYGNPPFATEESIGGDLPKQIGRENLYNWIESELVALTTDADMPAFGTVPYPRATKGAVWAVLARMYLNAEVYTGTAQWEKAKAAAAEVIKMGYKIHKVQRGTHTLGAYAELFMQDNSTNGANEEFIFAVAYDKMTTQSWGGTTHLISGALNSAQGEGITTALGVPLVGDTKTMYLDCWNGYHVSDQYVANFDLQNVTWEETGFGYNRASSDKRAFFYNGGQKKEMEVLNINSAWICWKFNPLYSNNTYDTGATNVNYKFSSADFPLFRLAEMYLIYAEAVTRIGGGMTTDATALGYIKELRDRAGVTTPLSLNLDFLLQERARELMWEGHRRTDLIRYGYFTKASFSWPFKGGIADGKIAIDAFRTVYPILSSEMSTNPNLVQNPGY
ncbi:MAG: RagB/SusD family nutrient uptake outer membrane protein [Alistipes sp.]